MHLFIWQDASLTVNCVVTLVQLSIICSGVLVFRSACLNMCVNSLYVNYVRHVRAALQKPGKESCHTPPSPLHLLSLSFLFSMFTCLMVIYLCHILVSQAVRMCFSWANDTFSSLPLRTDVAFSLSEMPLAPCVRRILQIQNFKLQTILLRVIKQHQDSPASLTEHQA